MVAMMDTSDLLEHDRKDRNIVDRKAEKSVDLVNAFHSSVPN